MTAVPSTVASLLAPLKPSLSVSTSLPPVLSTPRPRPRPPPVIRSHTPASPSFSRFTPRRCCLNRSGDSSSPPKFRGPPGFDEENWVVVMDKPGGDGATEEQMLDCYIQTLAQVVGSEDEAVKKIYGVLREESLGFGCVIDDLETVRKLKGLPGVVHVCPDQYLPEYTDPADTLKHLSVNIIRFFRHKDLNEVKDGGSAPKWYNDVSDMEMGRVEDCIDALSVGFKVLDSLEVHSKMKSRAEQVLSELSVHVKQLCSINSATEEEAGKDKEKEKASVMEQVKNAVESLSLAQEAVDLLHSYNSHKISLMAQTLKQLSERVMELGNLTTQEADANHDDSKEEEEEEEEAPDEDQFAYAITFTDEETGIPVFVGIASDMAKRIDSEDKLQRMLLNMKKFTKYRENYKKHSCGDNPICSLDLETWFLDPDDFDVWVKRHFT